MRNIELALTRLLQIPSIPCEVDDEVAASLAGEYIRRVAVMAYIEGIKLRSPFFDPLQLIAISPINTNGAMKKLMEMENPKFANAYSRRTAECYLTWSEGLDSRNALACRYPDLFEPLVRLLELGGDFGLHHGELLVAKSAIPLENWERSLAAQPYEIIY